MPAAAEVLAAEELTDELAGPVGYSGLWLVLVVLGLVLVALYYAGVLWWLRPGRAGDGGRGRWRRDVPSARREHLLRLDRIQVEHAAGLIDARAAHQSLSETVRSYAATVSSLPAPTMTLDDLRRTGPDELVAAVELMYPPEFAPRADGAATERFDEALHRARRLVTSWS